MDFTHEPSSDKIAVYIQARMSSKRCPGKVLRVVKGGTILGHMIQRVRTCSHVASITVATSSNGEDDEIQAFCKKAKVGCFRGPLIDVAARLLSASSGKDYLVRLCGDSPFLDPGEVDRLISQARGDLTTNLSKKAHGSVVEVVRRGALQEAHHKMNILDKEHVTRYILNRPKKYEIQKLPYIGQAFPVDTEEDFKRLESVLSD